MLVANRYSSHASVSTLSRFAARQALAFPGAAPLEKKDGATATIDFAVKSMPETFDDENGNFRFDGPQEKRTTYNLVAAVTKAVPGPPPAGKEKEPHEMRAFVLGGSAAVSDAAFGNEPNVILFLDAVRWLGGEESFSGEIQTTEDAKIEHTKQKDVVWFYGLLLGAPGLVLAAGLLYTRRVRASARRTA
jgi:hypothetical protein